LAIVNLVPELLAGNSDLDRFVGEPLTLTNY